MMVRATIAAALLTASAASAQTADIHAGRLIDPVAARVLVDQRVRIVDGKVTVSEPAT